MRIEDLRYMYVARIGGGGRAGSSIEFLEDKLEQVIDDG